MTIILYYKIVWSVLIYRQYKMDSMFDLLLNFVPMTQNCTVQGFIIVGFKVILSTQKSRIIKKNE